MDYGSWCFQYGVGLCVYHSTDLIHLDATYAYEEEDTGRRDIFA